MKRIRLWIAMLTLILAFPLVAEQSENDPSKLRGTIVLKPKIKNKRPNAPSLISVECEYGDGFLKFTLPENVNFLTFRLDNVNNEEGEIAGIVSADNPVANIPSLSGEYYIECQDDGYRTYAGVLCF